MAGAGRNMMIDRLSIPETLLSLIMIPHRSGWGSHCGVQIRSA